MNTIAQTHKDSCLLTQELFERLLDSPKIEDIIVPEEQIAFAFTAEKMLVITPYHAFYMMSIHKNWWPHMKTIENKVRRGEVCIAADLYHEVGKYNTRYGSLGVRIIPTNLRYYCD